jgi:hypothetical protein
MGCDCSLGMQRIRRFQSRLSAKSCSQPESKAPTAQGTSVSGSQDPGPTSAFKPQRWWWLVRTWPWPNHGVGDDVVPRRRPGWPQTGPVFTNVECKSAPVTERWVSAALPNNLPSRVQGCASVPDYPADACPVWAWICIWNSPDSVARSGLPAKIAIWGAVLRTQNRKVCSRRFGGPDVDGL